MSIIKFGFPSLKYFTVVCTGSIPSCDSDDFSFVFDDFSYSSDAPVFCVSPFGSKLVRDSV